jgi:hypothetical protein
MYNKYSRLTEIHRQQAPLERTRDPGAEDKKMRKSSNDEGPRWREQNESGSAMGENGEMIR